VRYLGVLLAWLVTVGLSAPTFWYWFQALVSLASRLLSPQTVRLAITLLAIALSLLFLALCVVAEPAYARAPNVLGRFLRVNAVQVALLALGYGATVLLGPAPL
jgi:hypothetical protein